MKKLMLVMALAMTVTACDIKANFGTLESARTKAKENATWNAVQYRAASPYADWAIDATTDSTITAGCPQGDGWASVKLVDGTDPNNKISLKCSTFSNAVGCLTDKDFKSKSYAGDDGQCRRSLR